MAVVRLLTLLDQIGPNELEAAIADAVASNLPTQDSPSALARRMRRWATLPRILAATNKGTSRSMFGRHGRFARGRFRRELPKSSKANNHAERRETA